MINKIYSTDLFISEFAMHGLVLPLVGKLCFRLIFLRIREEKRDLNHHACYCIIELLSRQTHKSAIYTNLRDSNKAFIAK